MRSGHLCSHSLEYPWSAAVRQISSDGISGSQENYAYFKFRYSQIPSQTAVPFCILTSICQRLGFPTISSLLSTLLIMWKIPSGCFLTTTKYNHLVYVYWPFLFSVIFLFRSSIVSSELLIYFFYGNSLHSLIIFIHTHANSSQPHPWNLDPVTMFYWRHLDLVIALRQVLLCLQEELPAASSLAESPWDLSSPAYHPVPC